jgi:hypothetical protein
MTKTDRDQRLAAKLRENLKRRKMQARARNSAEAPQPEENSDADQPSLSPDQANEDEN